MSGLHVSTCTCADDEIARRDALLARGWSQRDADQAVWGIGSPAWVRGEYEAAFPWLVVA